MAGADAAAAWVALRAAPGVGDVVGRRLLDRLGGPLAVLTASGEELAAIGCAPDLATALREPHALDAARLEVERIAAVGARVVALDAPEYPPLLRELRDAPLYLVARGARLLSGPAIAIVGSRRATAYGRETARALAEGLAHAGVTVVSGLARGIDGAAHEGALAARGCTIAVLGSGIDVIYPREHRELAERLVEAGTLLSERPVGTAPLAAHFPARNRILAGMTQGTVVIEAAERSGSLITARLANDGGREVFAVPGRIDSPLSFGVHLLIRQGATLVRGIEDVLEQIAPALRARAGGTVGNADRMREDAEAVGAPVLRLLADGTVSVDELIRETGRPAPEILALMLDLELRGMVRQLPGRQFQLTGRFAGLGGLQ
jgi:DNA processing protein